MSKPNQLSNSELMEDFEQLVSILVNSHPDPFLKVGGQLMFYQTVDELAEEIRNSSLSVKDFYLLACKLTASIGDGHTKINEIYELREESSRLQYGIFQGGIYIKNVVNENDTYLIGAKVEKIGGYDLGCFAKSLSNYKSADNYFHSLVNITRLLCQPELIRSIFMAEGAKSNQINVELLTPDKKHISYPLFDLSETCFKHPNNHLLRDEPVRENISWKRFDDVNNTVIFRIPNMVNYKEAYEYWESNGYSSRKNGLPQASRPVVSRMLVEMFSDMVDHNTSSLIIDLRGNRGGCSIIEMIIRYFIYGIESSITVDMGYSISRYSELYYKNFSLDKDMEQYHIGYDFSHEKQWLKRDQPRYFSDSLAERRRGWFSLLNSVPSFKKVVEEDKWEGFWNGRVSVITSASTYSAALRTVIALKKHGAYHIGVSPAQSPNCFTDALYFQLNKTKIEGQVSFKKQFYMPEQLLSNTSIPDVELTYQQLLNSNFNPDASINMALEFASKNFRRD